MYIFTYLYIYVYTYLYNYIYIYLSLFIVIDVTVCTHVIYTRISIFLSFSLSVSAHVRYSERSLCNTCDWDISEVKLVQTLGGDCRNTSNPWDWLAWRSPPKLDMGFLSQTTIHSARSRQSPNLL